MYDGAEYEDECGMGRMDWTLDESLDLVPSDHWDANPRSPSPDALEREICSNFTCCGLAIPDMHDLLAHFEDSHVFVLSKQHSSSDAHPSSVLASQTSPSPYSHQNDEYDPEPFVLSYPQPRALPSPCPIPSLSSATQTFPALGVCITSGSRPSTPELSAAGSDSDPVSCSPASVFTPLSPFMPFSSAFSATPMKRSGYEPEYSLLHSTSLSRVDRLPVDVESATSMYAYPSEVGAQPYIGDTPLDTNSPSNPHPHHLHAHSHPPILSLPPASFSLPASSSARTRPTPAAKAKKSTTKKAASGATSVRVHDLGRRIKERRGDVDMGGGSAGGSAGPKSRMKRGPRGKFVSNAAKVKERLMAGSASGSSYGLGSGMGDAVAAEVGGGVQRGRDEGAIHTTSSSQNPSFTADAPSQASCTSIEQQERTGDLTLNMGVRAGSSGTSTSGRKSREKAFRCPTTGCAKSYLNPNGLKYHLEKGTCTVPRARSSFPAQGPSSTTAPNSFLTTAMHSNGIPAAPAATHVARCPST